LLGVAGMIIDSKPIIPSFPTFGTSKIICPIHLLPLFQVFVLKFQTGLAP